MIIHYLNSLTKQQKQCIISRRKRRVNMDREDIYSILDDINEFRWENQKFIQRLKRGYNTVK